MIKTLSLENDKVLINEVVVLETYDICNKYLKDLQFPPQSQVCSIYRYPHMIIPNGNTQILANDKLFVVSSNENKNVVIDYIRGNKK